MLELAIFGVAFTERPLGGLVLGMYGDRVATSAVPTFNRHSDIAEFRK
jgi:hypothetical protein